MKTAIFLLAFFVFVAGVSAKDIPVYFRAVVPPAEEIRGVNSERIESFSSAITRGLGSGSCRTVIDSSSAKYSVTAFLRQNQESSRVIIELAATDGNNIFKPVGSINAMVYDDGSGQAAANSGGAFINTIQIRAASLCEEIDKYESRGDNKKRAFVPGLAQIRNDYPILGATFIIATVGTLAGSGIFAYKASDNLSEADKRKKIIVNGLATSSAEHEKFLKEYEDYNQSFKDDRAMAIGLGGAFVAVYILNVWHGFTVSKKPSGSQAFLMPTVSPSGNVMANAYWMVNF